MTTTLLTKSNAVLAERPNLVPAIRDYTLLTIGAVLLVYSFSVFMLPFGIAGGGVGGAALVANRWFGFSPGLAMLVLNLPVLHSTTPIIVPSSNPLKTKNK